MYLLNDPKTLYKICTNSIIQQQQLNNFWCKEAESILSDSVKYDYVIGPFEYLPCHIIKEIIDKLSAVNRMSKNFLQLLIVSQLDEIKFSKCTKIVSNEVIDFVGNRCIKLRTINLSGCNKVTRNKLHKIITQFGSNLQTLCLNDLKCVDDTILHNIGINCKKLRHLEICDLKNITLKGIKNLLYEGANARKICSTLSTVKFYNCSKHAVMATYYFLLNCKNMCVLESFNFWDAIAMASQDVNNKPFVNIISSVHEPPLVFDHFHDEDLSRMLDKLPNIKYLGIVGSESHHRRHLPRIFRSKYCFNITHLSLEWWFKLDTFVQILWLFPNLQTLSIDCQDNMQSPSNALSSIERKFLFPKLKHFSLRLHGTTNGTDTTVALKQIIGNCTLETFNIESRLLDLPYFINWCIGNYHFDKLKFSRLYNDLLDVEAFWCLIFGANFLQNLDVQSNNNLTIKDLKIAKNYIIDNNMKLTLKFQ